MAGRLKKYLNSQIVNQKIGYRLNSGLGKPDMIFFEITHLCNSRCTTCNYWKNKEEISLSLKNISNIIKSLNNWLGRYMLIITGGEPLIKYTEVLHILNQVKNNNKVETLLCTNALALNDEKIIELSNSGLNEVSISLNSLNPQKNDETRGIQGSYSRALNAMQKFKKQGINVSVDTIISNNNVNELEDLARWTKKNDYSSIFFNFLQPTKNSKILSSQSNISNTTYDSAIKSLIELKSKGYPISNSKQSLRNIIETKTQKCLCGVRRFAILPNGDVKLCARKDHVGNICTTQPKDIWNSSLSKKRRQEIKKCQNKCDPTGGLSCSTRKNIFEDINAKIKTKIWKID